MPRPFEQKIAADAFSDRLARFKLCYQCMLRAVLNLEAQ
jgi:hypothetical protein